MKKLLGFGFVVFLFVSQLAFGREVLIGGKQASKKDYPEILYMTASAKTESWMCSGTVVGPEVYLTAAHCADNGQVVRGFKGGWEAVCTRHPSYTDQDNDSAVDISICKRTDGREWKMQPAIISDTSPQVGDIVTLTGYGCTRSNGTGGNNGHLKVGEAPVIELEIEGDYWFYTLGKDALCMGDSGGPAYRQITAPRREMHELIGVNSRGDIKTMSMLAPVYIELSQNFLELYALSEGVKICGISHSC